jgi:hypothetical protein
MPTAKSRIATHDVLVRRGRGTTEKVVIWAVSKILKSGGDEHPVSESMDRDAMGVNQKIYDE